MTDKLRKKAKDEKLIAKNAADLVKEKIESIKNKNPKGKEPK